MPINKSEKIRVVEENRNGVKYITHYVNRPIKNGDIMAIPEGVCGMGMNNIERAVEYVYKESN